MARCEELAIETHSLEAERHRRLAEFVATVLEHCVVVEVVPDIAPVLEPGRVRLEPPRALVTFLLHVPGRKRHETRLLGLRRTERLKIIQIRRIVIPDRGMSSIIWRVRRMFTEELKGDRSAARRFAIG